MMKRKQLCRCFALNHFRSTIFAFISHKSSTMLESLQSNYNLIHFIMRVSFVSLKFQWVLAASQHNQFTFILPTLEKFTSPLRILCLDFLSLQDGSIIFVIIFEPTPSILLIFSLSQHQKSIKADQCEGYLWDVRKRKAIKSSCYHVRKRLT